MMNEEMDRKARGQSILDLLAALDEDEAGRIPALSAIKGMNDGDGDEPGKDDSIGLGSGNGEGGDEGSGGSPEEKFASMLKKMLAGG